MVLAFASPRLYSLANAGGLEVTVVRSQSRSKTAVFDSRLSLRSTLPMSDGRRHLKTGEQGFGTKGRPLPDARHVGVTWKLLSSRLNGAPRKEVIHPHLPVGIPCYDFTPVTGHSLVNALLAVGLSTSGASDSHGVTGGVYKTRERIHRSMLISDY